MPNHDMSDTACRERAEAARRLDTLDNAIKILADTCEDLLEHDRKLKQMIMLNREAIDLLRERIDACLKQE